MNLAEVVVGCSILSICWQNSYFAEEFQAVLAHLAMAGLAAAGDVSVFCRQMLAAVQLPKAATEEAGADLE